MFVCPTWPCRTTEGRFRRWLKERAQDALEWKSLHLAQASNERSVDFIEHRDKSEKANPDVQDQK